MSSEGYQGITLQEPLRKPAFRSIDDFLKCPYEAAFHREAIRLPLSPTTVAIDLDRTLMAIWFAEEYPERQEASPPEASLRFEIRLARRIWNRIAQHGPPAPLRLTARRWPWLQSNLVTSAPAPGLIGLIAGLREQGCRFYLMTASTRERVEWLFKRIPFLEDLFDGVACAEDLERGLRRLSGPRQNNAESTWAPLHRMKPISLAMKSPLLAETLFGHPFDLLLDDSPETHGIYEEMGNKEAIVRCDARNPVENAPLLLARLAEREGLAGVVQDLPRAAWLVLEDPLFSLLERSTLKLRESA